MSRGSVGLVRYFGARLWTEKKEKPWRQVRQKQKAPISDVRKSRVVASAPLREDVKNVSFDKNNGIIILIIAFLNKREVQLFF